MTARKPKPPAVTVRLGRTTVSIPLEVVTAAMAHPQGQRLLSHLKALRS